MKARLRYSGKIFFLSLMFILLILSAYAQEGFRLSDYKNPDYHWKRLDLNFNLGGQNGLSISSVRNNQSMQDSVNSKNNNIGGDFSAEYFNTRNSRHYQGEQYSYINGRAGFFSLDDISTSGGYLLDSEDRSRSGAVVVVVRSDNRFYNDRRMFLEAGAFLNTGLNRSSYDYEKDPALYPYYSERDYTSYGIAGSVSLLAGIGRIEDVQDARLAVYILEDLEKSGDLRRPLSSDEVVEMAEFITQLKNQRYFDARLRKIAEITALDSFMTAKDYRSAPTASYFTLLNDNWDFAAGPVRSAGYRFSFGIVPSLDWNYNDTKSVFLTGTDSFNEHNSTERLALGLDGVAAFLWEKPVRLSWQHTASASARYALFHEKEYTVFYDYNQYNDTSISRTPNLHLNGAYTLGYYPNSRTSIRLTAFTGMEQWWGTKESFDVEQDYNYFGLEGGLEIYCYYYFSERLRLTVSAASRYVRYIGKYSFPDNLLEAKNNDWQSSVSAGLVYSIF